MSPDNAWMALQGIETLPMRMEKHCENAMKVATHLSKHPKIEWVRYCVEINRRRVDGVEVMIQPYARSAAKFDFYTGRRRLAPREGLAARRVRPLSRRRRGHDADLLRTHCVSCPGAPPVAVALSVAVSL